MKDNKKPIAKAKVKVKSKPKAKKKVSKKKTLSSWDWTVLVAAWRYYENRGTIAAATFPFDIIERYFRGDYDNSVCDRIARQFVEIDHRNCNADEWNTETDYGRNWFKFYCFLRAWHDNSWEKIHGVDCFYCEATNRHYPKDKYIANPFIECWIDETAKGKDNGK